ncbi:uncharacterized protein EV154DRAFT_477800 [Mucor mucedo]|uniref:uncharacterized protein n=1 Tax=Mucor mucedo TaxID=29922 RepID=UPI00221E8882|nr:uncharacterized protein EV154DRAFT_477800 [Mucor mucedo]KAI7895024.1 hypothetical protein EV154DRAFT_477800 [Mucor mucedo]
MYLRTDFSSSRIVHYDRKFAYVLCSCAYPRHVVVFNTQISKIVTWHLSVLSQSDPTKNFCLSITSRLPLATYFLLRSSLSLHCLSNKLRYCIICENCIRGESRSYRTLRYCDLPEGLNCSFFRIPCLKKSRDNKYKDVIMRSPKLMLAKFKELLLQKATIEKCKRVLFVLVNKNIHAVSCDSTQYGPTEELRNPMKLKTCIFTPIIQIDINNTGALSWF